MELLFSVIIPTYNRAGFLLDALTSVLSQSYKNWECIVVDDGSTDNTAEVVSKISDQRIQYFYKRNEERSIARNYGISRAKGKYICFLDSDDIYYPSHLESLAAKIEEDNFPVAMLNTGMIENRDGTRIVRPMYCAGEDGHAVCFIWEKFVLPTSVCLHNKILKVHRFPEKFSIWEDTHLWLRVAAQYPFVQIKEVTTQWNVHKEGTVEKAFRNVTNAHVRSYIRCISHLFKNYREILNPYLDERNMRAYQYRKFKMFMGVAFKRKQYMTFLELYVYGIFKFDGIMVNQFVRSLIAQRRAQNLHNKG